MRIIILAMSLALIQADSEPPIDLWDLLQLEKGLKEFY